MSMAAMWPGCSLGNISAGTSEIQRMLIGHFWSVGPRARRG
jgi:hypothetical protein